MEILISWSGKQSQGVGRELFAWLKETIPGVSPWISSESIAPGSSWVQALMDKLQSTRYGDLALPGRRRGSVWRQRGTCETKRSDVDRGRQRSPAG